MGKYTNAQIKYPVFSISSSKLNGSGEESFVVVGGGGAARSGVKNYVTAFAVVHDANGVPTVKETAAFDTDTRLATSAEVSKDEKFVAASVSEYCMLLQVDKDKKAMQEVCFWRTDKEIDKDTPACQNVVRFSPKDSSIVVTGGDDHNVYVWKLEKELNQEEKASGGATEGATAEECKEKEDSLAQAKEDTAENDDSEANEEEQDSTGSRNEEKGVEVHRSPKESESTAVQDADEDEPEKAEDISPNEATSATDSKEGEQTVLKFKATLLFELTGHLRAIKDIVFNPSGTSIASISADNTCRLWDLQTGKLQQVIPSDTLSNLNFRRITFVEDDRMLTLQASPGRFSLSFIVEFKRHKNDSIGNQWGYVRSAQVFKGLATTMHIHKPFVTVGDATGGVTLVDLKSLNVLKYFPAVHGLPVTGLTTVANALSNDVDYIVTGSMDKTVTMIPAKGPSFPMIRRNFVPIVLVLFVLVFRLLMLFGGEAENSDVKEL